MNECVCYSMQDEMENRLMQLTFWAHKTVLFEKIKQQIEKEEGKNLEKMAEILVQELKNRVEAGKNTEKSQGEFQEKLRDVME